MGAFPISLRMPLGPDPVPTSILLPWLRNLLPESQPLVAMGRILGASPDDVIGLLQHIGRDTAGALVIGAQQAANEAPGYRGIPDEAALERIIEELPSSCRERPHHRSRIEPAFVLPADLPAAVRAAVYGVPFRAVATGTQPVVSPVTVSRYSPREARAECSDEPCMPLSYRVFCSAA